MKYVLLALVLFVAFHLWRSKRRKAAAPPPPPQPQLREPEDMVACARCGVHMPHSDALLGPDHQHYCSSEHRKQGPN